MAPVPSSFEKINYSLRPAKNIERKMICELLQRLDRFHPIRRYRYLGFGSVYFSDFALFHRRLGISDMTSLERVASAGERVRFNRPYRCIEIVLQDSNAFLPTYDWSKPGAAWLDYDSTLTASVLADVETAMLKAASGSFVAVTVNADQSALGDEGTVDAPNWVPAIEANVGPNLITPGTPDAKLRQWGLAELFWRILDEGSSRAIDARNGPLATEDKVYRKQIMHLRYRDSSRMVTVAWVLHSERDRPRIEACDLTGLEYYSGGADAFEIDVPRLTFRELRFLEAELPKSPESARLKFLPKEQVEMYERVYRFFPSFVDAEL